MGKHKLDDEVEDILQHYGIKGMKWKVKKGEETDESAGGGGDGEGEEDKESLKEIGEALDAMKKKLGSMSDAMKKKGKKLLEGIFGKSKTKLSKAKPNAKMTKQIKDAMKAYDKASPAQRKAMKNGYTIRAESSTKSGGSGTKFKTSSGNSYSGKSISDKEYKSLMKKLKKAGMKKSTINKGKSIKNKDGSTSKKIGKNTYNFRVDRSGK